MTVNEVNYKDKTFRIEAFDISGTKKYQAFMGDYVLTSIEENKSVVIMMAIKTLNEV